jgi:hypothetical protein
MVSSSVRAALVEAPLSTFFHPAKEELPFDKLSGKGAPLL